MRTIFALFLIASTQLVAQSVQIAGVWKADLQKSKLAGPPPSSYLTIIEQKDIEIDRRTKEKAPAIEELTGTSNEHGTSRALFIFLLNGKPIVRPYGGIPTRTTASISGNVLTVTAETAGRPIIMKRTYETSSDGQMLTVTSVTTDAGKEQQSKVVLLKQPDSAAAPLRAKEETAEAHFKNVKTAMKTLPESEFIDNMRYFAWSLGKNCEFCHVKGHFDSDDKKEKKTAREMITMANGIDTDYFKGHPAVRCFTCHEFHQHPLARPAFSGEPAPPETTEKTPAPGPAMHEGQKPANRPE